MSYSGHTIISGYGAAATYKNAVLRGHWNPISAARVATRMKIVGTVEVTHITSDLSGLGRGGYDRKFRVENGVVTQIPLDAYAREYDDGADVNAAYDELEAV